MRVAIFDIDGTLADSEHRAHHLRQPKKDWDAFYAAMGDDPPRAEIVSLAKAVVGDGWKILLCSGRPASYRGVTEEWMKRHGVEYHGLYMRHDGDYRDDTIVKREMLSLIRAMPYEIMLVVDDRKKVVSMWRSEGLVCLQCADGDF